MYLDVIISDVLREDRQEFGVRMKCIHFDYTLARSLVRAAVRPSTRCKPPPSLFAAVYFRRILLGVASLACPFFSRSFAMRVRAGRLDLTSRRGRVRVTAGSPSCAIGPTVGERGHVAAR